MKRHVFFIMTALLGIIYFFSGSPTEISDRTMIQAIGIDKTNTGYCVTMQIFSPEGGGNDTAVDASLPNVSIVNGKGNTVYEAVKECYTELGGNVFIGQNQIFLFGKDIDFSKKDEVFGYFLSTSEAFMNVDCAIAENTAEEILKVPISGNAVSSEIFSQMIDTAADNGRCIKTSFIDLIEAMESQSKAIIMPVISKAEESKSDSSEETLESVKLQIDNGAVFTDGKYVCEITYEQMGDAAALIGKGNYIFTDVSYRGITYSKTFKVTDREVTAKIENNELLICFDLRVDIKDEKIFANALNNDEVSKKALEEIDSKVQSFANEISQKRSAELLNADDYIKRFYPELYKKYKDNLDVLYDKARVIVNIDE